MDSILSGPDWIKRSDANTRLLFHGTGETITGALRGGGYDQVLWFGETPVVAQNYIPAAGSKIAYVACSEWEEAAPVSPPRREGCSCVEFTAALQMGFELATVEYRNYELCRWSWRGPRSPKRGDVKRFIAHELGYSGSSMQWVKTRLSRRVVAGVPAFGDLLHADYMAPGKLFVIPWDTDFKLFDMSTGDSDLLNLQYHDIKGFNAAKARGFDGVIIDDFAQTDTGNIGHRSIGLFENAWKKLDPLVIDCKRFVLEDCEAGFPRTTPEWSRWLSESGWH